MLLPVGKNNGHILIDDNTGKIISILVHNAIPNKTDFLNLHSSKTNPDNTHTILK